MSNPSVLGLDRHLSRSPLRLQPSLSVLETWSFSVTGHFLWLGTAPGIHAALGPKAIFVWLPAAIISIMLNLQVKCLGTHWPKMSGGTPNYTTRLLKNYPGLARYAAIGYFLGWVSIPPVNAIILTDLIKANMEPLGISCPVIVLRFGFTCIAFIVAFSGTRALAILHIFFVIPAIGFLVTFCLQGVSWSAFYSASVVSIFPSNWSLNFIEWAKWYLIATYAIYGCETAATFVADSRQPSKTLQLLSFSASLIPVVYLGGSWVLMHLATTPDVGDNTFLNLLAAAKPFWGRSATFLVTFLIVSGCLLGCATTVSVAPRILYQLSLDHHLAPVFAVISQRGVLGPGLIVTFCLSLFCLIWGDITHVVMITGTGYLTAIMGIHLGLWLRRGRPEVQWPWWSLGFFLLEAVVLIVGGLAWSWQDLLVGMSLPLAILAGNAVVSRVTFGPFSAAWWIKFYRRRSQSTIKDFVMVQVGVIILLVCSTALITWGFRLRLNNLSSADASTNLFVVLLLTLAFVGVAIACWTSLPQVAAIVEAREVAEHLFTIALDAILVLDEDGMIRQANPAAEKIFGLDTKHLLRCYLNKLFFELAEKPNAWPSRSEQTLAQPNQNFPSEVEVTISDSFNRDTQEYVVILRDITKRKQAEVELRQALQIKQELATTATAQAKRLKQALQDLQQTQAQLIQTEKMSSLGHLVAGVAHEINNPVNFIYGNLSHASTYTQDILNLINLYQQHYPHPDPEIQNLIADIDLDFVFEDFPKMINSMAVGAERIQQIVLTLRNFSRLDEAEMKLVDIHEGIDSTLLILQHRFKAKPELSAIKIIQEYGDIPKVECLAGQLNQVFMNILSNAIDALHELSATSNQQLPIPTLTIRTQLLNCDWVRISIKDNGPGMTDSVKASLFDPFFTTKPVGEGTGLGLSISYQIVVDKHGGRLKCLSTLGQGAEFLIEIPIEQRYQAQVKVS